MAMIITLADSRWYRGLGNKVRLLRFLSEKGYRIPTTFICTPEAYARYLDDQVDLLEELKAELAGTIRIDRDYAVRSSANVEDQSDFSYAGQFKSVLHVRGLDDIMQAIWSIWASARSPQVQTYLERHTKVSDDLKMSIIIQEMVPPQISGVSFSKNPVTGLDEVVVEAVTGSGETLMQEGVTPLRWVNKWGKWIVLPTQETDIPLDLIERVVAETRGIEQRFGRPVDLEWVYDGQSVTWVQLREITSLEINLYSNRISAEVFPGLIKPLVWSVNVPLVNGAWVRLFTELIGPNDLDPNELARAFCYRAYFNMGVIGRIFGLLGFPRESLELMLGIERPGPEKPRMRPTARTLTYLPRIVAFAIRKSTFGRQIEHFVQHAQEQYRTFDTDGTATLNHLIGEIRRLNVLNQEVSYYNIVTQLLMQLFSGMLRSSLARLEIPFESLDLMEGIDELQQFDPIKHLADLSELFSTLDPALQARIRAGDFTQFCALPNIEPLLAGVEEFIARFGHLSDSGSDFSVVPWRENPDLVLKMITSNYEVNPNFSRHCSWSELDISRVRRLLLSPLFRLARHYQLYREKISSLYTYGFGLFRNLFLAIGDKLEGSEWIESRYDVFYLYLDELQALVRNDYDGSITAQIALRKADMVCCADLRPPAIIFGDQDIRLNSDNPNRLEGTPTSRGYYTGAAKVLRGMQDYSKLETGDVLVIPYSDVAWTPLFAKAGAVIAESGGILSHSSIVAREYGIPAVVSVPDACRLRDGTIVTVDGFQGFVVIEDKEED